MANENPELLENSIKLLGEVLVAPGTSQLLDGNIKSGLLHTGGGILARLALGVPAALLVAGNSFSKSATNKSLLQHLLAKGETSLLSIKQIIEEELAAGKTPEEIKAGLAEDVDDIYEQTKP